MAIAGITVPGIDESKESTVPGIEKERGWPDFLLITLFRKDYTFFQVH